MKLPDDFGMNQGSEIEIAGVKYRIASIGKRFAALKTDPYQHQLNLRRVSDDRFCQAFYNLEAREVSEHVYCYKGI